MRGRGARTGRAPEHGDSTVFGSRQLLRGITSLLQTIIIQQRRIMTDMATIQRQIAQIQSDTAAQSTVVASAITLINGLSGQLRDVKAQLASQGGVDTSALDAVITQLENNNTTLSTAVAANTAAAGEQPAPAAPPATPPAGGDVSQATDPQQSA